MAAKLASTTSSQGETAYLVDSNKETTRSELENTCRALVFSFVKMRESDTASTQPSDFFSNTETSAPGLKRGTNLSSSSSNTLGTSDSEGSSVDVSDSSAGLASMAQQVHISQESESLRGLVPASLPSEIRDNISKVEEEDLKKLYDVEGGARRVQNNDVSAVELIVLHLRSYRNIINFEISDMEAFRSRFVSYFGSILADLMEVCYADRGSKPMSEVLAQDFQAFREQKNHKSSNPTSNNHTA